MHILTNLVERFYTIFYYLKRSQTLFRVNKYIAIQRKKEKKLYSESVTLCRHYKIKNKIKWQFDY